MKKRELRATHLITTLGRFAQNNLSPEIVNHLVMRRSWDLMRLSKILDESLSHYEIE